MHLALRAQNLCDDSALIPNNPVSHTKAENKNSFDEFRPQYFNDLSASLKLKLYREQIDLA